EILRPRWYYAWFNASTGALSSAAAANVFQRASQFAPVGAARELFGVTAFATVYFLVNTLGVSLAAAFQQHLRWLAGWKQDFLWTAPGFYASAAIALGIHALFPWLGIWSLIFLPPAYLIYYSYPLY